MKKIVFFTIVLVYLIFYTFFSYAYLASGNYSLLRSVLYNLAPLAATLAGFSAVKVYGISGVRAKAILYLAAGNSFWFIGEIIWSYFVQIGIEPLPSIADFFYFAAYPLLFMGLLLEYKLAQVKLTQINKTQLMTLGALGGLIIFFVCYFGVYLAYDPEVSAIQNIIIAGYGLADLTLVLLSGALVVIIREYKGGKIALPWFYFLLGLVLTLLADILFAIYTDEYDANLPLTLIMDYFWLASYIFMATAFFHFGSSVKTLQKKLKSARSS